MSEVLALVASGGMAKPSGGWHDLLLSGKKRTNSAMGTGQTPPQNVSCLLLGWTVLANKAEPIPYPLQHTHTHTRMHTQTPFFWIAVLLGTSQGGSEWEVGV